MNPHGGVKLPSSAQLAALGKSEEGELNAEQQAMELIRTIKCTLRPSHVHGIGVMSLRDIKKGEQCYIALTTKPRWFNISFANLKKYLKQDYPEILQIILDRWPQVVNGAAFLTPNYDARLTSFMNHSDTPNYDPVTDLALEDIPANTEIFENYRVIPNYEKAYPWLQPVE